MKNVQLHLQLQIYTHTQTRIDLQTNAFFDTHTHTYTKTYTHNLFLYCRCWASVMRWTALMTISHSERDGQWYIDRHREWDNGMSQHEMEWFVSLYTSISCSAGSLQWSLWWMVNMFVSVVLPLLVCMFRLDCGTTGWSFASLLLCCTEKKKKKQLLNSVFASLSFSPLHGSQTGTRARQRRSWRRRCF